MRHRQTGYGAGVACTAAALAVTATFSGAADAGAATGGRTTAGTAGTGSPTAVGAAAPVPGPEDLKSALLTAADTGMHATVSSDGGGGGAGGGISGCAALSKVLGAPTGPRSVEVDLNGGQSGPLVSEVLTADSAARAAATYARTKTALASCHKLTLSEGNTHLDLALKPIRFGGAESTAVRMDGELRGVQVNGYLAFGHVGPVTADYMFFQVADGSSHLAASLYRKAMGKVKHVVANPSGTRV